MSNVVPLRLPEPQRWDESRLLPYQLRGIQHIHDHPNAMLWEGVGMGKTVQVLTAFSQLQDQGKIPAVLVIGTKRIIQAVWRQEAEKWDHLRHLRFSLIQGSETERVAALKRRADIYLVNYEQLPWLASMIQHLWLRHGRYPPFWMCIYDEVTKVKNATSKRVKAWKKILPYFKRRVGLTGEPASNGYKDLHGQYLCVDSGARLGQSITAYRSAFLRPLGFMGHDWAVTRLGREQIHKRIADITLELSTEDYLDLPPIKTNIIWIDLPAKARVVYDRFENEFFAELDSGAELEAPNEAAKINKLIQIASGAAYLTQSTQWEEVHKAKLEALDDLVEEHTGRPMLLGYNYIHEANRIAREYPEKPQEHAGATFLSSKLSEREVKDVLRRWEYDEIPLLCGHGASMGHGLNLQHGSARSVVWFSLPWSLELYNQLNGRIAGGHRRKDTTFIHHILAKDTVDEMMWDVIHNKATTQAGLRRAIKTYREQRK